MSCKPKIKTGMGGSRCGKSRWMHTEFLKLFSKKRRRNEGKVEIRKAINE